MVSHTVALALVIASLLALPPARTAAEGQEKAADKAAVLVVSTARTRTASRPLPREQFVAALEHLLKDLQQAPERNHAQIHAVTQILAETRGSR